MIEHHDDTNDMAVITNRRYVHDVGHPGVNNKLLQRLADDPNNSMHPAFAAMAIRYR